GNDRPGGRQTNARGGPVRRRPILPSTGRHLQEEQGALAGHETVPDDSQRSAVSNVEFQMTNAEGMPKSECLKKASTVTGFSAPVSVSFRFLSSFVIRHSSFPPGPIRATTVRSPAAGTRAGCAR